VRKFLIILLLISAGFGVAFAKDNALLTVKVIPLPEDRLRIDFQFEEPIKQLPASFITQKPPRLVLDFIDTKMKLAAEQKSQQVKLGSLNHYTVVAVGDRVRTILDLERTVSYSGSTSGKVYSLIINGKSSDLFEKNKEVFITNQSVHAKNELKSLDFRGIEKQGGRVLINVSDSSIPIDVTQHGKELVVNFLNTKIPANLMKHFDVADFHSPVQEITLQQEAKNVRMVVLSKGDYGHFVYQVNKQFMLDVFPLTEEELQQQKLKKQVFTGKRITLNFQNINIRAVLQLLADFTGINMVVSDKVQGDITLRLNDIPWDQALDIILTTQGLDKRKTDNVMLIDTKKSLDSMEEAQLKSQQIIQKLEPIRSDLIQVNYAKAAEIASLIKDKDNSLLSERGKISVDPRTNNLWIQDTGTRIEEVRQLIKELDVPVRQVLIEARIVDATKDFTQDLGIRWGVSKPSHLSGTLNGANQFQLPTGAANPAAVPVAQRLNLDLAAAPVTGTAASVGVALAKLGDNILLDLELSALESEGRAELISSPRLITTNQQAALIESGEEIPYQEATSSGATSVAFKKAVLSLKVTPQITPDNKILMELQINQDRRSAQPPVNGVPAIDTKQIQTKVLVNNGQTIVLGGIYRQDKNKVIKRIPFFGSLPVLGPLFGNKQITLANEELLIFITPKIITNSLSITTIEGRQKDVYK
jgi:type IV pilus assembly protein PilQ